MLRVAIITEIHGLLRESDYFGENDFTIQSYKIVNENLSVLSIEYKFKKEYWLKAYIPDQKTAETDGQFKEFRISLELCPGELSDDERIVCTGKSEMIAEIKGWLARIREDLIALPVFQKDQENKERLEKIMERYDVLEDKYFSRKETEDWKKQLDHLEDKLTSNVEIVSKNGEQKEKLDKIHLDISILKQKMSSHSKKGWTGAFVSKSLEWSQDPLNKEVLIPGAEIAKEILAKDIDENSLNARNFQYTDASHQLSDDEIKQETTVRRRRERRKKTKKILVNIWDFILGKG